MCVLLEETYSLGSGVYIIVYMHICCKYIYIYIAIAIKC